MTDTHTRTRAHTEQSKVQPSATMLAWTCLSCEPTLGPVCTGIPSWGRTGNLQETIPCLTGEDVGTQSPTHQHGQLVFASPVNTRYPLMLQLGGPLPQLTPGHHLNSWVDTHAHTTHIYIPHSRNLPQDVNDELVD